MDSRRHLASALLLLFVCVLGIASDDSGHVSQEEQVPSPVPSSPQPTTRHDTRISGDNWYGCSDREYFKKLIGYAVDHDNEAFKRGLATGIVAGDCTLFKNGERVYLVDTAIFSGLIKVRKKGETQEYWTNIEAVH